MKHGNWDIILIILSVAFLLFCRVFDSLSPADLADGEEHGLTLQILNQNLPEIMKNLEEITTNINRTTTTVHRQVEDLSLIATRFRERLVSSSAWKRSSGEMSVCPSSRR